MLTQKVYKTTERFQTHHPREAVHVEENSNFKFKFVFVYVFFKFKNEDAKPLVWLNCSSIQSIKQ